MNYITDINKMIELRFIEYNTLTSHAASHQTRGVYPMSDQWWACIADGGSLSQCLVFVGLIIRDIFQVFLTVLNINFDILVFFLNVFLCGANWLYFSVVIIPLYY